MHFVDIIILLALIFVIYSKLKNALGTRPEVKRTEISEKTAAKIFDIIMKETGNDENVTENKGEIVPNIDMENLSETDKVLIKIPMFNKEKFINNAKRAFEIIVAAFSSNDTETLKNLVTANFLKKINDVVEVRKKEGLTTETEFIGFEMAEIENAKIKNNIAQISVKFITEQVNILRNAKEEIIQGDPNFIQKITDVWTFEKNIKSTDPRWLLASTKK